MEKENPPPYEPQTCSLPPPHPDIPPPPPLPKDSEPTVIITQNIALTLGPDPSAILCPFCHAPIITNVITEPTTKTHLWALLLCFLGGLMCVWIPYCTKSCQSQSHFCPNCKAYLGKYDN